MNCARPLKEPCGAADSLPMSTYFSTVHNFHEAAVYQAVLDLASDYPSIENCEELLADVACVALNRLPPRYIRHAVDMSFYMSDQERMRSESAVREAVRAAFEFVQSRTRKAQHA